jgi:hypothetical protein
MPEVRYRWREICGQKVLSLNRIYGAALDLSRYTSSISGFRVQQLVCPALISRRLHLGVEDPQSELNYRIFSILH